MIFRILLLALIQTTTNLWSQSDSQFKVLDREGKSTWQNLTYDMGNVFEGVGYAYSRPLYWGKSDFSTLGLVLGGTAAVYTFDQEIDDVANRNELPKILEDYGWYAGSPQNNYGFVGAVYLTGLFTKSERLRRTGVLLIAGNTSTGFVQQLTKSLVGRARPKGGFGKNHFRPFGGDSVYRSFPSGHAVLTFTNAHIMAKLFDNGWIKAGIYAVGVIPGISRIYADAHWASDVVLSWAMSYFMVEAIDFFLDRKYADKFNKEGRDNGLLSRIDLRMGPSTVGFAYKF